MGHPIVGKGLGPRSTKRDLRPKGQKAQSVGVWPRDGVMYSPVRGWGNGPLGDQVAKVYLERPQACVGQRPNAAQ